MSAEIRAKYDDVYKALEPLRGLNLLGTLNGPPTNRFPLRELVEKLSNEFIEDTEYRGHRIVVFPLANNRIVICHFGLEEADDFCICVEGENAWKRIHEATVKLSKLFKESYTLMLQAIVHALQGMITAEEGAKEKIEDPDEVIEELLTWLPEYVAIEE
ncbi:hypothetical protein Pyrfu_1462 [Pyrolobus fumarii 1A]|uniref:Uncharacterized protein n=1 Tax=Pyrolobus fumarii (strain DSM 11204 / 1A) TaxID=694429 RepID=G0EH96_PYRF1|nr:hypothetical protein [Pyrolobus fumarii]AEM39320.1 hypothetical protein Pyrfu_1462 [Pyrolobus fumarii 1A]